MANTVIQLKHSTVTGNVPSSLANGEISINSRDGKFFYSTPAGSVITHYPYLGPAGLNKEIQFNDNGTLGSNSGLAFDKTSGSLNVSSSLNVGNGSGGIIAGANVVYSNVFVANTGGYFQFPDGTRQNTSLTATSSYANASFATANSKVKFSTSATAPTSPQVGDIWYYTTNDVLYEYLSDGTNQYWFDIQTPTLSANASNNNSDTSAGLYANSSFLTANSAFSKANNALANTTGTFSGDLTTTGNVSVGGNLAVTGTVTGSNLTSKNTSSWTVATGTNTYSITVPVNGAYQIWVRANIPNGIIAYQATVHVTNTNVPVLGTQRAWNYTGGGSPILLTTMPTQIVGTEGTISTATVSTTTANRFDFVINNSSGSSQTVQWGYVTLG